VSDPLGLSRPVPSPGLRDRAAGFLTDLGLSPRTTVLGGGVVLIAVLGWWWLRSPAPPPAEAGVPLAPAAASPATTGTATEGGPVWAHAAGAVRRPGLYQLAAGSRVADLVDAAGGALPAADLDQVNLAAVVADGSQVFVPRRGEAAPAVAAGTEPAAPEAPVDVNAAGPDELDTLPGVGPATAAAIIEYREANGPFATVDDLIDVPGIGEAKLAELRDRVTV
jgi:competence protein ComEA